MKTAAPALFFATLALLTFTHALFAQNPDSLAYNSLRTRVASIDSVHPALLTADALAGAGLFADATAILGEHAPDGNKAALSDSDTQKRPVHWRISSGVDYYHLEDVDTVAMTAEELRDYKRLTETPLSVWVRAKSTIQPQVLFIKEITPEVYISERKGRLSTSARIGQARSLFHFEPSVKGEKRFSANAANTPFAPGHRQPSDMGGAALVMTASNTGKSPGAVVSWSSPVSANWEHYRKDQGGYESFVEYGISPSVEIRTHDSPIGARFSAYGQYEDFYRGDSDTLDVARFSGRAEGFGHSEKFSGMVSIAWMGDRYPHAAQIEAIDRFEGSSRAEYTVAPFLTGRLRVRGRYEHEQHGATDGNRSFTLSGSEITFEPELESKFGSHVALSPLLLWERRWSRKQGNNYLWEARLAWEPGVRIGWSSTLFEAALRGAFRDEKVFDRADSRSLRAGADASVNIGSKLSVNLFADYQYRAYEQRARITENISLSASATLRM